MITKEHLLTDLKRELAVICDCTPETLPASLKSEQACKFFNLSNERTLQVWKSTKRHNLAWIKRGRFAEVSTRSALEHAISKVVLPGEVA